MDIIKDAFNDVEGKGVPTQEPYDQDLLRKYLEGSLQNPIMATTRRPAYRAVVAPSAGGTDFIDLQKAINYVNELGGGVIFIKSGTYVITTDITLYSNILLLGEDPQLTIIDFNGSAHAFFCDGTSGDHKNNVEFHNLTIRNINLYDSGAIHLLYADNVVVDNCVFEDIVETIESTGRALYVENCINFQLHNSVIQNSDSMMFMTYATKSLIEFNQILNIDFTILQIYHSSHIIFRHNYLDIIASVAGDSCIYFGAGTTELIFDSNSFLNCGGGIGIWTEEGGRISVTNNVFTNYGSSNSAILLDYSNRCMIANNRIYGFNQDGISIDVDTDYSVINSNVSTDNGRYGINIVGADCNKNVVVGNVVINNATAGVNNAGTGTIVASNVS